MPLSLGGACAVMASQSNHMERRLSGDRKLVTCGSPVLLWYNARGASMTICGESVPSDGVGPHRGRLTEGGGPPPRRAGTSSQAPQNLA